MPGLLRGIARTAVVAGTASGVAGRVRHRQSRKWAQEDEPAQQEPPPQQYAPPPQQYAPPPPAAPAQPPADPIQRLKDLAELKSQGVLTDDEFAVQKAKILQT
jgi:hypothetical protein